MSDEQYLDIEDFRLRVGDDAELMIEIFGLYLEDSERLMMKITDAIGMEDFVALKKSAHALKGTSASISAKALQELAYELENICALGDLTNADSLMSRLRESYEITVARIKQNLGNPEHIQGTGRTEE